MTSLGSKGRLVTGSGDLFWRDGQVTWYMDVYGYYVYIYTHNTYMCMYIIYTYILHSVCIYTYIHRETGGRTRNPKEGT